MTNNAAILDDGFAGTGGGILILGEEAELIAENSRIDDNLVLSTQGGGSGGGLLVRSGAFARLDRTLGPECPGGAACSSLSGNQAVGGAAAQVRNGGGLEIVRTAVHDNAALSSVISTVDGSSTRVAGATLTGNQGSSLFSVIGDSALEISLSSIAGNLALDQVILGIRSAGRPPGEVALGASIVFETSPGTALLDLDPEIGLGAVCMVVPPGSGLPAQAVATTADPEFVDLAGGDLHLGSTSPALDVCLGPAPLGSFDLDLDLDLRGHDLPEVPDRVPGAVFDAGADEIGPPGPVFADGFETGDTSAWTASTP